MSREGNLPRREILNEALVHDFDETADERRAFIDGYLDTLAV